MSTTANNNIFSFMFADYFLALAHFLSTIETFKKRYNPVTQTYEQEKPIVMYGQPSAAYRKIQADKNNINGKTKLPVISFVALQFDRIKARQNPYAIYKNNYLKNEWDENAIALSWAPQVYKITYNFSVWTNNNKSRDDLLSRIVRYFNPTLTLKFFPDPVNNPHHFIYMPFEIEDQLSDATDLEQIEEKDTRDLVRTDFILTGESVLPLETSFHKDIRSIGIELIESKASNAYSEKIQWDISEVDGEYILQINPQPNLI